MPSTRPELHYNYQRLDTLLEQEIDPATIGDDLDEIMSDLISYARCHGAPDLKNLEWRYYILRSLRDCFWKLEAADHGSEKKS